jgi:hypothetical protein
MNKEKRNACATRLPCGKHVTAGILKTAGAPRLASETWASHSAEPNSGSRESPPCSRNDYAYLQQRNVGQPTSRDDARLAPASRPRSQTRQAAPIWTTAGAPRLAFETWVSDDAESISATGKGAAPSGNSEQLERPSALKRRGWRNMLNVAAPPSFSDLNPEIAQPLSKDSGVGQRHVQP